MISDRYHAAAKRVLNDKATWYLVLLIEMVSFAAFSASNPLWLYAAGAVTVAYVKWREFRPRMPIKNVRDRALSAVAGLGAIALLAGHWQLLDASGDKPHIFATLVFILALTSFLERVRVEARHESSGETPATEQ